MATRCHASCWMKPMSKAAVPFARVPSAAGGRGHIIFSRSTRPPPLWRTPSAALRHPARLPWHVPAPALLLLHLSPTTSHRHAHPLLPAAVCLPLPLLTCASRKPPPPASSVARNTCPPDAGGGCHPRTSYVDSSILSSLLCQCKCDTWRHWTKQLQQRR